MAAPQPYQQPREGFVITTQYFPLSFMLAAFKPVLSVNGWAVPNTFWGRNVVPAPPGQYQLHVHTPYMLPTKMGQADYQAVLHPGRWIELEYKAPMWSFSRGSLGPAPQSYNGLVTMLVIMGVTIAFAVLMVLIAIIGAV